MSLDYVGYGRSYSRAWFKKIRTNYCIEATMSERIKVELPKVYSKDLLEVLFKWPYTKRQFLMVEGL